MTTTRDDTPRHTGERGHKWEHQPAQRRSRVFQEERELEGLERPRMMPGPLACTACGELWPGTAPCVLAASA